MKDELKLKPNELLNPDGTIITYEEVTAKLQSTFDRLLGTFEKRFGHENYGVYIDRPDVPVAYALHVISNDLARCKRPFVEAEKRRKELRQLQPK